MNIWLILTAMREILLPWRSVSTASAIERMQLRSSGVPRAPAQAAFSGAEEDD